MKFSLRLRRQLLTGLFVVVVTPGALADEVGPECRGVAAGVVATMRAAGEITDTQSASIAVTAARRACAAAREDLGQDNASANAPRADDSDEAEPDSPSVWDLLTSDKELKPGNERLRRLRN